MVAPTKQRISGRLRDGTFQMLRAVREFAPGTTDKVVLETADESNLLLLTEDKDFGEMV